MATLSTRALEAESDHCCLPFQAARDLEKQTKSNRTQIRSVQGKSKLKWNQAVLGDADDDFEEIRKIVREIEDSDII